MRAAKIFVTYISVGRCVIASNKFLSYTSGLGFAITVSYTTKRLPRQRNSNHGIFRSFFLLFKADFDHFFSTRLHREGQNRDLNTRNKAWIFGWYIHTFFCENKKFAMQTTAFAGDMLHEWIIFFLKLFTSIILWF